MPIETDFRIDDNGDIRHTGDSTARYSVIEFHRFLQDYADNGSITGDDFLDITDDTPSDRSTDNIITLTNGYNIDDTAAEYLYDGSITQDGGATRYSGLVVVGAVETGTVLQIIQDGNLLRNYWGTGLNADAGANILLRIMVKTIVNSVPIDGGRILVVASEFGDTRSEFSVTLGLGNSTAAIFTGDDLNNNTAEATVEGWSTIVSTEGLQLIDVNNDGSTEPYYVEWDRGSQTINELYERAKWFQKRPTDVVDASAATGAAFTLDNGTITGQAQSFIARGGTPNPDESLTSVTASMRHVLSGQDFLLGEMVAVLYSATGSPATPNVEIGRSQPVLANRLFTTYTDVEFVFDQDPVFDLTGGTEYVIAFEHAAGTASNYVEIEGSSTSTITGNRAENNGGWTGSATSDLQVTVRTSPILHNTAGVYHRGVTTAFDFDTEVGGIVIDTNDELVYGTFIDLTGAPTQTPIIGEAVEETGGAGWRGQLLAFDSTANSIVVRISSGTVTASDAVTFVESTGTATVNGAPVEPQTATAGGRMRVLAVDNTNDNLYVQILTGTTPANNDVLYMLDNGGAGTDLTDSVNVDIAGDIGPVATRTIQPTFIGGSTGTALIGANGIGVQTSDLTNNDQLFDLGDNQRQPPVTAVFTVSGMDAAAGGGRLLVTPRTGSAINTTQSTVQSAALTGAAVTSITTDAIPLYAPASGKIRVVDDSGRHREVGYASRTTGASGVYTLTTPATAGQEITVDATAGTFTRTSGSFLDDGFLIGQRVTGSNFTNAGNNAAFTIEDLTDTVLTVRDNTGMVTESSTGNDEVLTVNGYDFSGAGRGAAIGSGIYIAYIDDDFTVDSTNFSLINPGNLDLYVRFRDGRPASAIKTFENSNAAITNSGGSATVIRTPDV